MNSPATPPAADKPRRIAMQVLGKISKWAFYLFLCLIGLVLIVFVFDLWLIEIGWYIAFGWINFILKNMASVELNLVLLAEGMVSTVALGVGTHYFCRWLYREAGPSTQRAWRWQWTASGLAVVMLLFVAGIGAIGVVHQAAWLFTAKGPLLVDSFSGRMRVSEAILAGAGARNVVQEYYESKGRLPQSGEEAEFARDATLGSKYVSAVEIREQGVVVVTLNKTPDWPDGGEITITPRRIDDASAKTLSWKCRSTLPPKLLPGSCRE